ncbi:MAG: NAD(P)/FAD-dependent oxidoreductase [Cellulosilyticaceae bacterium]
MNLHYVQGEALFTRINHVPKQYPYLTENRETEVVVIGGGVTGAIVAYYMTEAGIPCVVLEKERIAHGSTSITTSLLQYELDSNGCELEQYVPLQQVTDAYKLGLKALDEIDLFIKKYGNGCDYTKKDTLLYTAKKAEIGIMQNEYTLRKNAGLDVRLIEEGNADFSFDLKAGVYATGGGAQLDPYAYTHQLLQVSVSKGLEVYENTEVTELHYTQEGVEVETSYGYKIKAKKVVLATGYNTDYFTKRQFGTKTVTYNIATKPVASFEGWHKRVLIRDNEDPYHYYRTTEDGRILAGGEDIDFYPGILKEQEAEVRYERLKARVQEMFPKIGPIEIDYKYCGAFAATQDNLGFIGPDPEHKHLWYCLGYGANGILFAILGGMMLSKLYSGEEDPYMNLFRVNRFDK